MILPVSVAAETLAFSDSRGMKLTELYRFLLSDKQFFASVYNYVLYQLTLLENCRRPGTVPQFNRHHYVYWCLRLKNNRCTSLKKFRTDSYASDYMGTHNCTFTDLLDLGDSQRNHVAVLEQEDDEMLE